MIDEKISMSHMGVAYYTFTPTPNLKTDDGADANLGISVYLNLDGRFNPEQKLYHVQTVGHFLLNTDDKSGRELIEMIKSGIEKLLEDNKPIKK